jgi:amidohydrolase
MSGDLSQEISAIEEEVITLRRDFHQHPELGLKETRTAGIIADYLERIGLTVTTGVGQTGVIGLLQGAHPGKSLMMRADMDALPIQEENQVPYRSENNGLMHACGHDGHMAILLGTAKILSRFRGEISGNIKFVFQPGEEGYDGARLMIEEGVLENPRVEAAIGLHLSPFIQVGKIGIRNGAAFAGSDAFSIRVNGQMGHGAHPESGVDAIFISGNVITSLQSLVSREVSALNPVVVHIGMIKGGTAGNIIADRVTLRTVVRTMDPELRRTIPQRLDRILKGITSAYRGSHEIRYLGGVGPVVNDPAISDVVRSAAIHTVGEENILHPEPSMGSDDMARFLEAVPGCYFGLGIGNKEKGYTHPIHQPLFDMDESGLAIGVATMVRSALGYLQPDDI